MFNRLCLFSLLMAAAFISERVFAQSPEAIFEQANKMYMAGDYDGATVLYESILEQGYESSELYYNLGNSYFRSGKTGYAILNYERALRLSPGDSEIKHNLAFANSMTVDKVEALPSFFLFEWWEGLLAIFTLKGWVFTAYTAFILLLFGFGFYFLSGNRSLRKAGFISGLTLAAFLLVFILISGVKYMRETNIEDGIIVSPRVAVKLSPDTKSADAFLIHEGLKVRIEDKVNEWYRIRLQDGKTGWLDSESIKII